MKILPGLPTLSALMLAAVLTAWLGVRGPINLSALEKWQTLMTGIMAIIAAGIAYRGAIAKVRHDREVLETENRRRKLSLYLKVQMACQQLRDIAQEVRLAIGPRHGFEEPWVLKGSSFKIEEPPELEEAWTYLDLFPRPIIAEIRIVRDSLRRLAALVVIFGDAGVLCEPDEVEPHYLAQEARALVEQLRMSSSIVSHYLEPLVREMAPEMDMHEKIARFLGEPLDPD
jgi:hypothetical protein